MTEKVKLPKAVCDALDEASKHFDGYEIVAYAGKNHYDYSYLKPLYNQHPNLIMKALVLGYEPELTPEEQLKLIITKVHDKNIDFRYGAWYALKAHGIQYDWLEECAE